jgi:hypothetical protein
MPGVWVSVVHPHRPIVVRVTRPETAFRSFVLVGGILNEGCLQSSVVSATSRSLKLKGICGIFVRIAIMLLYVRWLEGF